MGLVDCHTQLISSWIFICLCSITKLKEHSRDICYGVLPPNMLLCCGEEKGVFGPNKSLLVHFYPKVDLCFWVQKNTILGPFSGRCLKREGGDPSKSRLVFLEKIGSVKEWVWYLQTDQIPKVVFDSLTRNVFSTLHRIDF